MAADALAAVKAYADAAASARAAAQGPATSQADASQFANLVSQAVGDAQGQLATADAMIQKGAVGQAPIVDVVTAVAAAELSLETVVAVRDEVIKAYQEILRMPI